MAVYAGPDTVEDGLVLCLDAANPSSYPGSGVTWGDLSNTVGSGKLENGPTYNSENGGGIKFDRSNDYVQIPSPFGNISWISRPWSLSFFFKNTSASNSGYFMLNSSTISNHGVQTYWQTNTELTYYFMSNDVGAANATIFSRITMLQGELVHVVLTYNGSGISTASNFTSYKNANLTPHIRAAGASALLTNMDGIQLGGINYRFGGTMFNFSMYNRVLTQTDVTQNFNALRGRFNI